MGIWENKRQGWDFMGILGRFRRVRGDLGRTKGTLTKKGKMNRKRHSAEVQGADNGLLEHNSSLVRL